MVDENVFHILAVPVQEAFVFEATSIIVETSEDGLKVESFPTEDVVTHRW